MGLMQSIGSGNFAPNVPIDIYEKTAAFPAEQDLVGYADSILTYREEMYQRIANYAGASEEMRLAMSTPTEENEIRAFHKLLQNVDSISHIFNFCTAIEQIVPPIFHNLCGQPPATCDLAQRQELALNAATAKVAVLQRAIDILAFVITFDSMRIQKPLVANDFSYYRRLLPKYQHHPAIPPDLVRVHDEDASVIALFTGLFNPLFSALKKAIATSSASNGTPINCLPSMGGTGVNNGPGIGGGPMVNTVLAVLANSCLFAVRSALAAGKSVHDEPVLNAAKAMTVALVLYDCNADLGAFSKRSTVRSKEIVELVVKHFSHQTPMVGLIKYSTVTINNAPDKIQELLDLQ